MHTEKILFVWHTDSSTVFLTELTLLPFNSYLNSIIWKSTNNAHQNNNVSKPALGGGGDLSHVYHPIRMSGKFFHDRII